MNKTEMKKYVGSFGHITGRVQGFGKSLYGNVLYVDVVGAVIFVDNDGYSYRFLPQDINEFEPMEFKDKN